MRPSASLCQSSRYRLLTLLLVLLLGILCAQTVGGYHMPHIFGPDDLKNNTVGGTPLARKYYLKHQCGDSYVQITPARGRHAINARGNRTSPFALLSIESISPTEVRIIGVKTQKYLCFSRRGRLIARFSGDKTSCSFKLIDKGEYTMLESRADTSWYVGFSKTGSSKRGYHFKAIGRTSSSSSRSSRKRPGSKKRRKNRLHRQGVSRRDRKLRHQQRFSFSPGKSKKRQQQQQRMKRIRKKKMCFRFTSIETEQDPSDPRVRNERNKKEYDPLRGSDISRFISTPDPR